MARFRPLLAGLAVAAWIAAQPTLAADDPGATAPPALSKPGDARKPAARKPEETKKPPAPTPAAQPVKKPPEKKPAEPKAVDTKSAAPAKPAATPKPAPPAPPPRTLLSDADRELYREAFAKAQAGRWAEAQALAAKAKEKLPAKILRGLEIAGAANFTAVVGFIDANPEWPYLGSLRQRAEELIGGQPDPVVFAWFERAPPQTWKGGVALGDALMRAGRKPEAEKTIRETWGEGDFDAVEERNFLRRYRTTIRIEDHRARLERLLWDGPSRLPAAWRMFTHVEEPYRQLARARIALMRQEPGVDYIIKRIPAELKSDPGLVYERVRWRRRKGDFEGARELLAQLPPVLPYAQEWWNELSYAVRRSLAAGDVSAAYQIARDHRQDGGATLAEAEFLAGWIALRFMRDPLEAGKHFATLYGAVRFPVSLSRAAYWAGRAAETAGEPAASAEWYGKAAVHVTAYYGQLAAARLNNSNGGVPKTLDEPRPARDQEADFEKTEMVRLVRMLQEIGEHDRAKDFYRQMSAVAREPVDHALIARLAHKLDRPDLAVRAARRAERAGALLIEHGYPLLPGNPGKAEPVDPALVHAVIRQESGFDSEAMSRAGARGLMQLMPETARLTSRELGFAYQTHRLTGDPQFNLALGKRHLAKVLEEYGGSVPLALAAYNAGSTRVKKWLRDLGDPRGDEQAMVDWIEQIPYDETRNYVQRVLENLFVYRQRLGQAGPATAALVGGGTKTP